MQIISKKITSAGERITIDLPHQFVGKDLQILIIPPTSAQISADQCKKAFKEFLNQWQGSLEGIDPDTEKFNYLIEKHF